MDTDADDAAEQLGDNPWVQRLARVGLVAYGVVHLLIGWISLRLAWGAASSDTADTSGAMATLAQQPFGKVLLASLAVGLLALALWQISEAILGARHEPPVRRVRMKPRVAHAP
jgi:hypothetical protein